MNPSCDDCKFNKPYSAFHQGTRMCHAKPDRVHTIGFARAHYGLCKPEGIHFEAKHDRTAFQR
jgi:hypothetical protein